MPGYGDLAQIKGKLNITGTDSDAALETLNTALSTLLDGELGRSFVAEDAVPVAETRTVARYGDSDVLALSWPLVSVVSIEYGGTWDGADWAGFETVAAEAYELLGPDRAGQFWAIRLVGATADNYRITGTWGDAATTVPADVVEAVNVLVAMSWKKDEAGPSGMIVGPDEMPVRPSNPWKDERVTRVIDRYRMTELVV